MFNLHLIYLSCSATFKESLPPGSGSNQHLVISYFMDAEFIQDEASSESQLHFKQDMSFLKVGSVKSRWRLKLDAVIVAVFM